MLITDADQPAECSYLHDICATFSTIMMLIHTKISILSQSQGKLLEEMTPNWFVDRLMIIPVPEIGVQATGLQV